MICIIVSHNNMTNNHKGDGCLHYCYNFIFPIPVKGFLRFMNTLQRPFEIDYYYIIYTTHPNKDSLG